MRTVDFLARPAQDRINTRHRDYADGTVVFTDNFKGVVTANGVTLDKSEAAQITLGADGSETWKGPRPGFREEPGLDSSKRRMRPA